MWIEKNCRKKFHLTHWLSIATHKWSIFPMFIYYLCVLRLLCFAFCNLKLFSFRFFFHHRSQLKPPRETFSLQRFFTFAISIVVHAAREKKIVEWKNVNEWNLIFWIAIEMRWNFFLCQTTYFKLSQVGKRVDDLDWMGGLNELNCLMKSQVFYKIKMQKRMQKRLSTHAYQNSISNNSFLNFYCTTMSAKCRP